MKHLDEYIKINEEQKSVFNEIIKYTDSLIDYLYNEGIVDYDDKHLVDYSKGKTKPKFKDIAKNLLNEYSKELSNTTQIVLKKYIKDGSTQDGKQSAVENAILSAISDFVDSGNCESYI